MALGDLIYVRLNESLAGIGLVGEVRQVTETAQIEQYLADGRLTLDPGPEQPAPDAGALLLRVIQQALTPEQQQQVVDNLGLTERFIGQTQRGIPGGYASLDANGKLLAAQLPDDAVTSAALAAAVGPKANQADLTALSDTVAALQTQANNTDTQLDQVQATALTIDEYTVETVIRGNWVNHVWTEILSANGQRVLWVAEFDCQVLSCSIMGDFAAIAADPTNMMTFSLRQIPGGGTFVSKTTNDEALVARQPWNLDDSVWDPNISQIAKGNSLSYNLAFSGTASLQFPLAITCRVKPI